MVKDTVNTGIEGLDGLLCGGFPKGSTVLITGPPGAGKTVMSLQYAFYQAAKGDRVLYVSTAEPIYKVNKFASSLSFYNLDLISGGINLEFYEPKMKRGYIEFQDYSLGQIVDEHYVGDFFDGIQKKVTRRSIDHLIVDSITSINMLLGDEIERRKKTLLFSAWVSRMGCTTLLTAEENEPGSGTERYLADAVIDLGRMEIPRPGDSDSLGGMKFRTLEVAKLRGKAHTNGRFVYSITRDGARIVLPGHPAQPRQGKSTGIPDLDIITGGMVPGELWHFNAAGSGPFDRMLEQMIGEALRDGQGVILYVPSTSIDIAQTLQERSGDQAPDMAEDILVFPAGTEGSPKGRRISFSPDKPGIKKKVGTDIKSQVSQGHEWRMFMDLSRLRDTGEQALEATYDEIINPLSEKGVSIVTFYNGAAGPGDVTSQRSTAVFDIWPVDAYWLLRATKAPFARSFEPYIIKREVSGDIRLLQI